jgi:transcriptional regulator with XRE-family HTH domain
MTLNRIAELLLREDMPLQDAADLCGVGARTVERWVREDTAIPDEHKRTLATRFDVTADYMLGWDRDEAKANAA